MEFFLCVWFVFLLYCQQVYVDSFQFLPPLLFCFYIFQHKHKKANMWREKKCLFPVGPPCVSNMYCVQNNITVFTPLDLFSFNFNDLYSLMCLPNVSVFPLQREKIYANKKSGGLLEQSIRATKRWLGAVLYQHAKPIKEECGLFTRGSGMSLCVFHDTIHLKLKATSVCFF